MAITVYTESVCDRCHARERLEGAHGHSPAHGWGAVAMSQRSYSGDGWDGASHLNLILCPKCRYAVRQFATNPPDKEVEVT